MQKAPTFVSVWSLRSTANMGHGGVWSSQPNLRTHLLQEPTDATFLDRVPAWLSKSKWVGEPDNTYPAFKDKIILNLTALSWAGTPVHRCEWKVIALLLQNPKQINSWGVTELDPRSLWWLEWEDFISSLDLKALPSPPPPALPPLTSLFGTKPLDEDSPELRTEHCMEFLDPGERKNL